MFRQHVQLYSKNIRKEKEGEDILQGKVEYAVTTRHHVGGGGDLNDGEVLVMVEKTLPRYYTRLWRI